MPVQFFGQFLLDRGIVNREQLLAAVSLQEAQNLKLGNLAIQHGYLSNRDAERINQVQRARDLQFGEAAIELRLLNKKQVDELVALQRTNYVFLGDAVIQCGDIEPSVIVNALTEFQQAQRIYDAVGDGIVLPAETPNAMAYIACIELTQKMLLRLWDVHTKIEGLSVQSRGALHFPGHCVQISFTGKFSTRYVLYADTMLLRQGARKLLQEDNPDRPTQEDLLREFANVVCGNILGILSKRGWFAEIHHPQSFISDLPLMGNEQALIVPFIAPNGGKTILALSFT